MNKLRANNNLPQKDIDFEALIDKHSNSIYKFCRSLTYSKEDAEDLFQETFLKAYEQISKINNFDNPQSFLFSTALFIWKSWKRKYARRKRLAPTEPLKETIFSDVDIEEDLINREEVLQVRQLINKLPDKFKVPIILHYTVEMSILDMAATLSLPPGTVKSRLHKARKLVEEGMVDGYYEK